MAQTDNTNTGLHLNTLENVSDVFQCDPTSLSHDCDLPWPVEAPSLWQPTESDLAITGADETLWDTLNNSGPPTMQVSQHDLILMPNPSIIQAPVHLSTTLIEYWFRNICPVRSAFDSEVNNNRSLARNAWTTSEAAFYAMQVMSAACLIGTMPQLSEALPLLREQAIFAINQGIYQVRTMRTARVTADLAFAVFALGTSSHWINPTASVYPWLESARELLSIWRLRLSTADALLYAYFCQALTYWEMLLTVVGVGSNFATVEKRRGKYRVNLRRAMGLEADDSGVAQDEQSSLSSSIKLVGTLPNSWCGISNEVVGVFGQVLALCRSACEYNQEKTTLTLSTTSKALCDIAVAHELEKELLGMDFDTIVLLEEVEGYYVDTQDHNTPVSHLLQTAEAYRKAGLLQLYLTFDDLVVSTSNGRTGPPATYAPSSDAVDKESRGRSLVDLALQLVATLEKIPAESGSKFIHPMLYLSAAVGLRFDKYPSHPQGPGLSEELTSGPSNLSYFQDDWDLLDPTHTTSSLSNEANALATFLPQSILKIAEARHLVWSRLSIIRQALPYKASDSLLRLVKAIWSEYDEPKPHTSTMHWLKVLSQTGLEIPL
ncbi:hypothetical protein FSARC_1714 [Fusarium sarcochroum]|uniref:Uncharacterized protein n=1 Tax=Fusarium sarcochroum TaxID=1208366 RepID=A0A8H4U814_9HYPO|nr:hypothetical protein FSARC_1714 [Fusarium sarcochroum]